MKNKSWRRFTWMILWFAGLFMLLPASGTAQAQEVDGYWELISDEVYQKPSDEHKTFNMNSGKGTYRAELEGDSFQATMTWTEPGQRYAAGQNVDLTLSVNVDEYKWYDDDPGYLHQGLNYMEANISARIDEPGIDFIGATRSSIVFIDSQGEDFAEVRTDYGKIA
ncbi:MAG: hypothetical protein GYA17_01800, partial [Chloroflexi bacterium]|nr:hypothetical protein [Chloroflexota bacterium]